MAALQIPPHSRRISGLAVLGLTLLAAGSFTAGLTRQIDAANAPSPFPAGPEASPRVAAASPAPAAEPQVAVNTRPVRHVAPEIAAVADPADAAPDTAPSAESLPATDASATAPDPSAPEPSAPSVTPALTPSQDAPNL
jgi:hypothetical protein